MKRFHNYLAFGDVKGPPKPEEKEDPVMKAIALLNEIG